MLDFFLAFLVIVYAECCVPILWLKAWSLSTKIHNFPSFTSPGQARLLCGKVSFQITFTSSFWIQRISTFCELPDAFIRLPKLFILAGLAWINIIFIWSPGSYQLAIVLRRHLCNHFFINFCILTAKQAVYFEDLNRSKMCCCGMVHRWISLRGGHTEYVNSKG